MRNKEQDKTDFEKWQKLWDDSAEKFAKESVEAMVKANQKPPISTSWLTNTPMDRDYEEPSNDEPSWYDIYNRSQDIDGIITDAVKYDQGETKPQANYGAFTPTKTNPTTQSSTGPDQQLRVTKNWIDSEELRELDDIKRNLEEMERKHHAAEVTTEKPATELKKQMESLRDRIQKLSEKINRSPETDVT